MFYILGAIQYHLHTVWRYTVPEYNALFTFTAVIFIKEFAQKIYETWVWNIPYENDIILISWQLFIFCSCPLWFWSHAFHDFSKCIWNAIKCVKQEKCNKHLTVDWSQRTSIPDHWHCCQNEINLKEKAVVNSIVTHHVRVTLKRFNPCQECWWKNNWCKNDQCELYNFTLFCEPRLIHFEYNIHLIENSFALHGP